MTKRKKNAIFCFKESYLKHKIHWGLRTFNCSRTFSILVDKAFFSTLSLLCVICIQLHGCGKRNNSESQTKVNLK